MRVLVTGSAGLVGAAVCDRLVRAGHDVVHYDLVAGQDVLDPEALGAALAKCDGVVHCAALLEGADPADIESINVDGTRIVLDAAVENGSRRFVQVSSLAVLGVFKGRAAPDYLPIDEAHPARPESAYERTKFEAEELVRAAGETGRVDAVILRCPGIWTEQTYGEIAANRRSEPSFEYEPYWEYGAFLDVRDLAEACLAALTVRLEGARVLHVTSSDLSTSGPTGPEWAERLHPTVEWRGEAGRDPGASLVRIDHARALLGWEPEWTWWRYVRDVESRRGATTG